MLNKSILNMVFIFAAGAVIGSAVTRKLVKNKYKQIAQEEIASVKETYARENLREKTEEVSAEGGDEKKVYTATTTDEMFKDEIREIRDIVDSTTDRLKNVLEENGYTNYSTSRGGTVTTMRPYVISPDDFGEDEEYETESLTYYSDGILADDRKNIIDADAVVGRESLTHFGEYEDDSVFVRNEELKTDYEILLDTRRYADIC